MLQSKHIFIRANSNVFVYIQATVPRWLIHNEAALFWRAKGNGSHALQCLRQVLSSALPSHRQLSHTNAANLLLHHGLTTQAQTLLEQALALNASEVKGVWEGVRHIHCIMFTLQFWSLQKAYQFVDKDMQLLHLVIFVFLCLCHMSLSIDLYPSDNPFQFCHHSTQNLCKKNACKFNHSDA